MTPSSNQSSAPVEENGHKPFDVERAPLIFLGFDMNIPVDELQETIEAWSKYIARLEQSTYLDDITRTLVLQARLRRGVAYFLLEEWEQALEDLRRVKEVHPDTGGVKIALELLIGSIRLNRGEEDAALPHWSAVLTHMEQAAQKDRKSFPHELWRLYLYRGRLLARLERLQEAVADFDRAAQFFPDCAEVYGLRGLARATLGDVDAGLRDAVHAVELEPTASSYQQRGQVRLLRREYPLALDDFTQALHLAPENAELQMDLLKAKFGMMLDVVMEPTTETGETETPEMEEDSLAQVQQEEIEATKRAQRNNDDNDEPEIATPEQLENRLEEEHFKLQIEYAEQLEEEDEHTCFYNALSSLQASFIPGSYEALRAAFIAAYQYEIARCDD